MSLPKPDLEKRLEKEYREGEIEKPPEEAMKEIGEVDKTSKVLGYISTGGYAASGGMLTFSIPFPYNISSAFAFGAAAILMGTASKQIDAFKVDQEKFPREELPGEDYTVDSVVELYKEK